MKAKFQEQRKNSFKPILAIIGGAGPDAAIDLQIKLSQLMKSKLDIYSDQDHYRVIVDNNTQLPNRDESLKSNEDEILIKKYVESIKQLELWGADILLIPCNAAHRYYDQIKNATSMHVINMIEEVASFILKKYQTKKIGLLSTDATILGKLYHKVFERYEISILLPENNYQAKIMQAIYAIKAGLYVSDSINKEKLRCIYNNYSVDKSVQDELPSPKELLLDSIQHLEEKGSEIIILGCTEIPLIIEANEYQGNSKLIDSTFVLANKAIDMALDATVFSFQENLPNHEVI